MKRVLGFLTCSFQDDRHRRSGSYYDVLGVGPYSSLEEIRRAYQKLAMKWHPDKWTRRPSMFAEAKRKFQIAQEAYEVLSDDRKRVMYNAGMYNPNDGENEEYSLEDLQRMLMEMVRGFDFPQLPDFEVPATTFDHLSRPDSNCFWVGGGTTSTGPSHYLHASS